MFYPGILHAHLRYLSLVIPLAISCVNDPDQIRLDFARTETASRQAVSDALELHVAVSAMTSPQETYRNYKDLLHFIGNKVGRQIHFRQRRTYQEINELLSSGDLDLAFICSGAYVDVADSGRVRLLAVPLINDQPTYQSYLVVPADSPAKSIADLAGKRFVFTDPLSLTGCLYPRYLLHLLNAEEGDFFALTAFCHGHDKAIQAVRRGMAEGACVDGLIYDFLAAKRPNEVSGLKIIERSQPFGIPPVVVPVGIDLALEELLRKTLLSMHQEPPGRAILSQLMIDRFVESNDDSYDPIRKIRSELRQGSDG